MHSLEPTIPLSTICPNSSWVVRSRQFICTEISYACGKTLEIIDLMGETDPREVLCDLGDEYLSFDYPLLVISHPAEPNLYYLEIWNLQTYSTEPQETIEISAKAILKGCLKGLSLALLVQSTEEESSYQIHLIQDLTIKGPTGIPTSLVVQDQSIDITSELTIIGNHCIYSNRFGKMITHSLDGSEEADLGSSLYKLSISDEAPEPIISSLLAVEAFVICSQGKLIQFWDFNQKGIRDQWEIDGNYRIVLSDGPLLVGVDETTTRIWNIMERTLLWQQPNKAAYQPSLTVYDGQIFSLPLK